jgi:prepilin-type N-terminal cleavage/methylation domain-containing protein/prepilin-type processing-associated H-X9-DG protein
MKPNCSNQRCRAFTLVELLIVIFLLAMLAAIILPESHGGSVKAKRIFCVNNLRQIGLAYRIWANDNGGKYPMDVSATNGGTMNLVTDEKNAWLNYLVISNELTTPKLLYCPADTNGFVATTFSSGFDNRNVSYFVGLNADTNHTQAFLAGDDNFEIGGVPVKSGLLEISSNMPIAWSAARHKFGGNIGLADGSVQSVDNIGLPQLLDQSGLATNRLAIP